MKILAIRGKNLASLPEFALDFDEEPLANAGLFAICGPTGAGKSTLLDALCVALFDKTPRLSRIGGVPVGHAEQQEKERLPANDVRGLLRRGSAAGFAEVDFLGCDQHRYRARWEVWRARRRPQGRLQSQVMSLQDLDRGQLISDTKKTDTLELIERRLGLDFDQFRRSALLAQGEFAAFLRADSGLRGQLLERMTGTQIYSEISRAAFEQQKREVAALNSLQGDVERHAVLLEGDRDALERDHRAAIEQLAALDRDIARTESACHWHQRAHDLTTSEREATTLQTEAQSAWDAAGDDREQLRQWREARRHRESIATFDRRKQRRTQALAALEEALAEQTEVRARLRVIENARRVATEALAAARAESERLAPELARAEALDREQALADSALERTQRDHESARARQRSAADQLTATRSRIGAREEEQTVITGWLAERTFAEPLVAEWSRWRSELERHAATTRDWREQSTLTRTVAAEHRKADDARREIHAEYQELLASSLSARARAEKARLQADAHSLDAIRARRATMGRRAEELRRLEELCRLAEEAAADRSSAVAARAEAEAGARAAETGIATSAQSSDRLAHRIDEAEGTLERIRLTVQLSAHRSALVAGEPCPLCGAEEHPHASRPAPEAHLLEQQRSHLDSLRQQREQAQRQHARALQQRERQRELAHASEREQASASSRLQQARTRWRSLISALGELALVDDPATLQAREAVASRLQAVSEQLAVIDEDERTAVALQAEAHHQNSLAASRESDLALATGRRDECVERARALADQLERAGAEEERLSRLLQSIEASFVQALGFAAAPLLGELAGADAPEVTLPALMREAPHQVRERCRELVEACTRRHQRLDELRLAQEGDGARLAGQREQVDELSDRVAALQRQLDERRDVVIEVRTKRAHLLAGQPSARIRARLTEQRREREATLRTAEQTWADGQKSAAAVSAQVDVCRDRVAQAQVQAEQSAQALDAVLQELDIDLPTLRRRCAVDERALEQRAEHLDRLQRAVDEARVVSEERARQRRAHESQGRPAIAAEVAQPRLHDLGEQRQATYRRVADLEHRLRLDDEAREARAQMAAQLSQQHQRAHLYQTLSHLIGSKDGKKFRVFAQSLTLDALLAYANHHLRDLAGRYRLVRVPGHDLDLQVIDRDMGDEVRSINSLSGGESFLVSLALALGLSSLAARDTQVESLLIDEGFGSLDPSTLDAALSVLDALQATGRQVGLISHVPGLAERVGVRVLVQPRGSGRSVVRVSER